MAGNRPSSLPKGSRRPPPDISRARGRQLKPAGFTLQMLPAQCQRRGDCAAVRDAEYLTGLSRFLPDEAYTEAESVKAAPGAERRPRLRRNIAGARKARIPTCSEWRRQLPRLRPSTCSSCSCRRVYRKPA